MCINLEIIHEWKYRFIILSANKNRPEAPRLVSYIMQFLCINNTYVFLLFLYIFYGSSIEINRNNWDTRPRLYHAFKCFLWQVVENLWFLFAVFPHWLTMAFQAPTRRNVIWHGSYLKLLIFSWIQFVSHWRKTTSSMMFGHYLVICFISLISLQTSTLWLISAPAILLSYQLYHCINIFNHSVSVPQFILGFHPPILPQFEQMNSFH